MSASQPAKANSFAFVTFLMLNDSYLPGALVLAFSLRRQGVQADLVCLVTADISAAATKALEILFDKVILVDKLFIRSGFTQGRPATSFMFTRMNALRLGRDGDLGGGYDKLVVLDADVLPLHRYERLFDLDAPAGILNEKKEHLIGERTSAAPPAAAGQGLSTWRWHEVYEDVCPHGAPIPKAITDRVLTDPENLGINGALFVLRPSMTELEAIIEDVRAEETADLLRRHYRWPDMQYLTARWSGSWHNVDVRYASLNGFPSLADLYGIHYGGIKPWSHRHKSFAHYSRFDDFRLWQRTYLEALDAFPGLLEVPHAALGRLAKELRGLG